MESRLVGNSAERQGTERRIAHGVRNGDRLVYEVAGTLAQEVGRP